MSAAIPDDYFQATFPLIKNNQVWLQQQHMTMGQHGGDVLSWLPIEGEASVEVYMEPYSSSMAREQYGLDIKCSHRIFCLPHEGVVNGLGVSLSEGSEQPNYIVVSVMVWHGHLECLLDRR